MYTPPTLSSSLAFEEQAALSEIAAALLLLPRFLRKHCPPPNTHTHTHTQSACVIDRLFPCAGGPIAPFPVPAQAGRVLRFWA